MKKVILIAHVLLILSSACKPKKSDNPAPNTTGTTITIDSIKDISGNSYATIKIGTQTWMKENLRTTKYNDGTPIPLVENSTEWASNFKNSSKKPMMCWANNDQVTANAKKYGALYNFHVITVTTNGNKNVCPVGWHVPSKDDWNTMIKYLVLNKFNYDNTTYFDSIGGTSNNKLAKALADSVYWTPAQGDSGIVGNIYKPAKRNLSGFSARPAVYREHNGTFENNMYNYNWWWSIPGSSVSEMMGEIYGILNIKNNLLNSSDYRAKGNSIRCVKD